MACTRRRGQPRISRRARADRPSRRRRALNMRLRYACCLRFAWIFRIMKPRGETHHACLCMYVRVCASSLLLCVGILWVFVFLRWGWRSAGCACVLLFIQFYCVFVFVFLFPLFIWIDSWCAEMRNMCEVCLSSNVELNFCEAAQNKDFVLFELWSCDTVTVIWAPDFPLPEPSEKIFSKNLIQKKPPHTMISKLWKIPNNDPKRSRSRSRTVYFSNISPCHGHGHGIFILATHPKGTWSTNPKPSFTQHPSADPTRALVSKARSPPHITKQLPGLFCFEACSFKVCRSAHGPRTRERILSDCPGGPWGLIHGSGVIMLDAVQHVFLSFPFLISNKVFLARLK